MEVTLQVGDVHELLADVTVLPPIGTKLMVPRELSKDEVAPYLEITGHEWRVEMLVDEEAPEKRGTPELRVRLLTRTVKR